MFYFENKKKDKLIKLTFIILNVNIYRFGRFTVANLIDGLHSEVIHHVFVQILYSNGKVFADLAIGGVKFVTVLAHLFNVVASDGRATIAARRLPGECNCVLGPVSVVEFLWGCRDTWNRKINKYLCIYIYII